ncbi:MAG: Usg family protein [Alphaproteobacteria bacterium]|nr:Usg family protein [Alphaproteobacteria bacterium]
MRDGIEDETELSLRLRGFRLTTAEVLYYMPDHPALIQSFVWQTLDLAPRYPRIHRFLNFWKDEIEAVIHSVRLASGELLMPAPIRRADAILHH